MKTINALLCLIFSVPAWSGGGVGVGNGRTMYHSPVGFSVSYPSGLDLDVLSEHVFTISNASRVAKPGGVSRIQFRVTKGDVKSHDQLLSYLQRLHPTLVFQPVSFAGARGYFFEHRSATRLDGFYYLFTGNYELVRIKIHAVAEGDGLALIAPIVRTFGYDETMPEVLGVRVDGPWRAGEVARLYVHARDEGSGIGLRPHDIWAQLYPVSGPGKRMLFTGDITPVGNDWYAVEMRLPQLQAPGRYRLSHHSVADQVGNVYFTPVSPFPLEVEVRNEGDYDVDPPRVLEFASAPVLVAGKPAILYFRVFEPSGIVENNEPQSGDCVTRFQEIRTSESIEVCGKVRQAPEKGPDWYAIEYTPNAFLPSGTYELYSFGMLDRAGHYLSLGKRWDSNVLENSDPQQPKVPSVRVQLQNSGAADHESPEILGVRANGQWRAGLTAELLLEVRDDVSGLAKKQRECLRFVRLTGDFTQLEGTFSICDYKVLQLGENRYSAKFVVPGHLKAGIYYLDSTLFRDGAGRGRYLNLDRSGTHYESSHIPRVDVTITR